MDESLKDTLRKTMEYVNKSDKINKGDISKMEYNTWKDKVKGFKVIDVRNQQSNFFPAIQKQASKLDVGEGFTIVQTFKPHPLYKAMESLGYTHHTDEVGSNEFHVHFYRLEKTNENSDEMPFKPIALLNYPMIDEDLGKLAVDFWDLTWNSDNRVIPFEMRLLLSLTNAVGAGRLRQATRELIKAYSSGVTSKMLDDVFELLAWNQGIGYFSSEIGPSNLFKAYKTIKNLEKQGKKKEEILPVLMSKYGETNPEVSVK